MATPTSTPAGPAAEISRPVAGASREMQNAHALVSVPAQEPEKGVALAPGGPVALLPVQLDVAVPVREFRVRNLLALDPGQLIETRWANGDDVPLVSGQVQLAWSEFEVVDTQLAVRITRLA